MTSIPAGKAKAQLLALLDEVARTQQEVVITKRGKPVARLAPLKSSRRSLKERLVFLGDVLSPVDDWPAP